MTNQNRLQNVPEKGIHDVGKRLLPIRAHKLMPLPELIRQETVSRGLVDLWERWDLGGP